RRFPASFAAQLFLRGFQLSLIQAIELAGRPLALRRDVQPEQGRSGNINMARIDKSREVSQEQGKKKHLNMRAVHIRIRQDADTAITQSGKIRRLAWRVRVDPGGNGTVVNFVIGKQT